MVVADNVFEWKDSKDFGILSDEDEHIPPTNWYEKLMVEINADQI